MPEAGHFPTRNTIARQHRRTETFWRWDDRNIVFVTQKQKISRLYRGEKALNLGSNPQHGTSHYVVRTGWSGSGSNQYRCWLGSQQMLQTSSHRALFFERGE